MATSGAFEVSGMICFDASNRLGLSNLVVMMEPGGSKLY